jgi:hypothetical protein
MRFAHAKQGLNNVVQHLSNITQVNNTLVHGEKRLITWQERVPGIVKRVFYPLEYQHLLDSHQYSLLLADGSFFQFFYQFDDEDRLVKARLAFYPKPVGTRESMEDIYCAAEDAVDRDNFDIYEYLYNWIELMELKGQNPTNTSHLRFDYDRDATAHTPSHLQFSGVHNLRLPAGFFPQPLAFVQLCESLLYGVNPIADADLGFEKNHPLTLNYPKQIISLSCLNPE